MGSAGSAAATWRGDAAAHGLAADEQRPLRAVDLRADRVDDRAITRLERRRAIRNPPALLGVEEVEGDDVDAQRRQPAGEVDHEGAALAGAGAVSEDERGAGVVAASSAAG